jgi:hypothetical protein
MYLSRATYRTYERTGGRDGILLTHRPHVLWGRRTIPRCAPPSTPMTVSAIAFSRRISPYEVGEPLDSTAAATVAVERSSGTAESNSNPETITARLSSNSHAAHRGARRSCHRARAYLARSFTHSSNVRTLWTASQFTLHGPAIVDKFSYS